MHLRADKAARELGSAESEPGQLPGAKNASHPLPVHGLVQSGLDVVNTELLPCHSTFPPY